jgi:hypothetical protein
VGTFSVFITIHNAFVFVDSNNSLTIQNYKSLTIIDISSQSIERFLLITLYSKVCGRRRSWHLAGMTDKTTNNPSQESQLNYTRRDTNRTTQIRGASGRVKFWSHYIVVAFHSCCRKLRFSTFAVHSLPRTLLWQITRDASFWLFSPPR